MDGDSPDVVLNREIVEAYVADDGALRVLIAQERPELERRRAVYRGKDLPLAVAGKTVIVVDDGAATGTTMKVAIRALKRRSPRKIIVALPVAPTDTVDELAQEADLMICLSQPASVPGAQLLLWQLPAALRWRGSGHHGPRSERIAEMAMKGGAPVRIPRENRGASRQLEPDDFRSNRPEIRIRL